MNLEVSTMLFLASPRHQVYVSLNQEKYNMLCGFF